MSVQAKLQRRRTNVFVQYALSQRSRDGPILSRKERREWFHGEFTCQGRLRDVTLSPTLLLPRDRTDMQLTHLFGGSNLTFARLKC